MLKALLPAAYTKTSFLFWVPSPSYTIECNYLWDDSKSNGCECNTFETETRTFQTILSLSSVFGRGIFHSLKREQKQVLMSQRKCTDFTQANSQWCLNLACFIFATNLSTDATSIHTEEAKLQLINIYHQGVFSTFTHTHRSCEDSAYTCTYSILLRASLRLCDFIWCVSVLPIAILTRIAFIFSTSGSGKIHL